MINWKVRLKNGQFLASIASATIIFIYQLLGIFEVVPAISQDQITQAVGLILNILVAIGIVTDPTTAGMGDSNQALEYTEPRRG